MNKKINIFKIINFVFINTVFLFYLLFFSGCSIDEKIVIKEGINVFEKQNTLPFVEESKSSIADIQTATRHLNEDLALGLVLNKAIRSHKDLYGYYGYGYGA